MKTTKRHTVFLLLLLQVFLANGQHEPIFSQYMFNMQAVNPAYAGIWDRTGFTALVRKQWIGVENAPLTQMLSLYSPVKNQYAGLGLNIVSDRFAKEERLGIFLDYAYELRISQKTSLRLGMKTGFMNYKNLLSQYQTSPDMQYDPAFQFDVEIKFMPNVGIGAFLYSDNYYLGFAMPRMIENDFGENRNNYSTLFEQRFFYTMAGYVLALNDVLKCKPTAMLSVNPWKTFNYELSVNFLIHEKLWMGAVYRSKDAVCFVSQWLINSNLRIGYAMDITITDISRQQYGTYEFMLSYDLDLFKRRKYMSRYF